VIKKKLVVQKNGEQQKQIDHDRGGARAKDVEDNSAIVGVVESVEISPKKPTECAHCDSKWWREGECKTWHRLQLGKLSFPGWEW